MIDFYPFSPEYEFRFQDAEELSLRLQKCSELQAGFWYSAQGGGYKDIQNNWNIWRQPDSSEFKTSVMLALAHGITGIELWSYTTHWDDAENYTYGIVENRIDSPFVRRDLWYHLKEGLIPRLKGKLGNTLMNLEYTGDFLQLQHIFNQQNPNTITYEYLTLELVGPTVDHNWHTGFFSRSQHPQDNYFMLCNLITTDERKIKVTIDPPYIEDYANYRFRNVEGLFDTTIERHKHDFTDTLDYTSGEGYLYELAPVVLYGGRLLYSEDVGGGMELNDAMIIEDGAILTIYDNYIANANIIVKNGTIINGENGKIIFNNGSKLIIEGVATINGTSEDKLSFEFNGEDTQYGVVVNSEASLTISNCTIENAETGIKAMIDAGALNIQYVDFNDCITSSITLLGQTGGPETERFIKYCTITNSTWGISASNLPELLIQENEITNTEYGIYLSNVTDAQIIGNLLQSSREEMAGIYFQSSGGGIRTNYITGHSVGIHLANSSPILGSNLITANKYHGLYVGFGSLPYMRMGSFIGRPPIFYAVSGYNKIFENGGYSGPGLDNDGSEIYFFNSNAVMDSGCNSIYDNRQPSPPLVNTLLLMNGYRFGFPPLQAQNNFWGDTVYTARFGNLNVNFIPYEWQPCPEPQGGGEDELVLKTQFGEVIDTVYSTGAEVPELTETEEDYSEAEGYFLTGNLTSALQIYEGIINSSATEEEKYLAYQRKYSVGKLTGQSNEFFNQLSITFSALAANTQDTLNAKILNQLSTLSKVGEQEYETAIGEFDGVIQQNPNTEEAVYAEIDALTTALLVESEDSTLQKGRLGKYLIKTSGDYNQRVDEILRKNFGSKSKETEKDILPTEYTLYQNYPNPFNPVTTIKYDLPNASKVSLIIYDILGRKVKELVNTKQQAGRYEIQFNASYLASGVYIYQLIAEKYISSKKMILLK